MHQNKFKYPLINIDSASHYYQFISIKSSTYNANIVNFAYYGKTQINQQNH